MERKSEVEQISKFEKTGRYNRANNAKVVSSSFGKGIRRFWEKIRDHARGQGIESVNILTDYVDILSRHGDSDALFQFLEHTRHNMHKTVQHRFIGTPKDRETAFKLVQVFWWQLALLKKIPWVIQAYERDYKIAVQFQQNFGRLPPSVKQYIFTVLLSIFQSLALSKTKKDPYTPTETRRRRRLKKKEDEKKKNVRKMKGKKVVVLSMSSSATATRRRRKV
jgi:hypothetical protein